MFRKSVMGEEILKAPRVKIMNGEVDAKLGRVPLYQLAKAKL